jgi:DNA methylase
MHPACGMTQNRQYFSDITVASFHLSHNGLRPIGSPSFEDWLACGQFIRNAEQSVQFWIGDWLLYGEHAYGKTDYERAVAQTGLSYQTLRIYKSVALAFPLSLRRNNVSFHHHKEIAGLSPATQAQLLQQAEEGDWPLFKLKQEKYRLRLEEVRSSSSPAVTDGLFLGEPAEHLRALPDDSVDMVLTTPPTADLATVENVLALLAQKLKENSHVYLFTDWTTYPNLLPLVTRYLTVKNLLVYQHNHADRTTPYRHVYGCMLFANTGERRYLNGRRDANVLPFSSGEETTLAHPTDKSLALLEYLIEKSSQPGEVVCDPFMGEGAVCLAAKHTGRRYIGIEKDKGVYDRACLRLAEVGGK